MVILATHVFAIKTNNLLSHRADSDSAPSIYVESTP